ncbi:MAG: restriction endonuclease subunit S, partial [Bacteroidetes bacterium]|nr:restriction endonuclease subunit S [Bacteroidota bacterium]
MNAEHLLALYDRVVDTPNAVFRLRRFVLEFAVRGKLVEQNPEDEPASELLKRIVKEKAKLVEVGKVRKTYKLPTQD